MVNAGSVVHQRREPTRGARGAIHTTRFTPCECPRRRPWRPPEPVRARPPARCAKRRKLVAPSTVSVTGAPLPRFHFEMPFCRRCPRLCSASCSARVKWARASPPTWRWAARRRARRARASRRSSRWRLATARRRWRRCRRPPARLRRRWAAAAASPAFRAARRTRRRSASGCSTSAGATATACDAAARASRRRSRPSSARPSGAAPRPRARASARSAAARTSSARAACSGCRPPPLGD